MTNGPGTISRQIALVGTSAPSAEATIKQALERGHETLRQLQWFVVTGQRGRIINGAIE